MEKLVEMRGEDLRDGGPSCDDYSEMPAYAVGSGYLYTE